jgi:hypothetical protein
VEPKNIFSTFLKRWSQKYLFHLFHLFKKGGAKNTFSIFPKFIFSFTINFTNLVERFCEAKNQNSKNFGSTFPKGGKCKNFGSTFPKGA